MGETEKILLSWSGGKDSAMALYELSRDPRYEVVALLTSIAGEYKRISHHGVREELLDQQAAAIGLPLHKLYLPVGPSQPCTNEVYEELMREVLLWFRERGVYTIAHGDIYLVDIRAYRERNLARVNMKGLFPLWKRNTTELVRDFLRLGFKAYLSCVQGHLAKRFAGQLISHVLLAELPKEVDPCGENGEFHSFVYDGPIFRHPVPVKVGPLVTREGRHYADLLPLDTAPGKGIEAVNIPPVA